MSATNTTVHTVIIPDYTFSRAHGTVMVCAWMIFASTGILFARYGRTLHIGGKKKLLGETIWFQTHRLALILAQMATLLGFFLILHQAKGIWVHLKDLHGRPLLAHSILGAIIVGCATLQVYMALFRCHADSRFRFIFNWAHRTLGFFAFFLSVPTIFIITFVLNNHRAGLVTTISIWTAWLIIVAATLEFLKYRSGTGSATRKVTPKTDNFGHKFRLPSAPRNGGEDADENLGRDRLNTIKLCLLFFHIIVAMALSASLIALIWT